MNVIEIDVLNFLYDRRQSEDGVFGNLLEFLYASYKRQDVNAILEEMDKNHKGLINLAFSAGPSGLLPLITSDNSPWLTSYGLQLQKEFGH